jgi:hypothetical protein
MRRLSVALALFFVATPVKITGQRPKTALNIVNAVKLDAAIKDKDVAYIGRYEDDMSLLQTFKLYGSIDLALRDADWAARAPLGRTWLIIPMVKLPLSRATGPAIGLSDCVFTTATICAATARQGLRFELPNDRFPHEVY